MKNHIKKSILILSSALLLAACGQKTTTESNGKDAKAKNLTGELTVYTAIEEELIPKYLESFEEKYPDVDLKIVRDSTGVITAKLLAEGKNTKADVVWGTAASSLLTLDKKDMLQGYTPKNSEKILPQYKDSQKPDKWVGNTAFMTGIVVNKAELKKRGLDIPKTYEDLTKPEYKGLIVMPHPASSGTGFLTVSAWLQLMKDKKGWNYMTKLHKNIGTYTQSGSKPAKLAASGEYPIGISLVYSGVQEKQQGAPVEVILPKEGLGWDVEANALIKKSDKSHDKVAKAFLDWAITDDVMKKYYDANGYSTMKNNYEKPEGFPKGVSKKMYKENDLKWAAENRNVILDKWEAKYGSKAEPKEE
ncbi:putative 2-aminoethylphosphonate ABC transporter substrate-binding protein [Priestia megaterium]|uniref:putative 2-aminoethylphosphonate ABC transporter substrate-binding protein n=1 Tax=Priestia megaterium TaxID=1404 RepID=UPI002E2046F4|nr:putative 2-aminoethylphosphonate ABC transporter substrate-binding protein [Priestia megaterium]